MAADEDDAPGVEAVQDFARGTLQTWLQDYTSADDDPAGRGRQWRSRLLEQRIENGSDDYRFDPSGEHGTGRVYRVAVTVTDVTDEYEGSRG